MTRLLLAAAAVVAAGIVPAQSQDGRVLAMSCLNCHGPGGKGKQAVLVNHPKVTLPRRADLAAPPPGAAQPPAAVQVRDLSAAPQPPTTQPQSDEQGITCRTCHLPHGRADAEALLASAAVLGRAGAASPAAKPMLRPGAVQASCATCHGPDALRRYLYYHQPEKRRRTHFWVSPPPQSR